MKRPRRYHSPEFKQEAVALVVEHGYSCAAAGRSLGVSGALIGRWRDELEDLAVEAFPGKGKRMRYRFINEHQKAWPVTLMCGVLGVSRAAIIRLDSAWPERARAFELRTG